MFLLTFFSKLIALIKDLSMGLILNFYLHIYFDVGNLMAGPLSDPFYELDKDEWIGLIGTEQLNESDQVVWAGTGTQK